jgi:hypothetical protein
VGGKSSNDLLNTYEVTHGDEFAVVCAEHDEVAVVHPRQRHVCGGVDARRRAVGLSMGLSMGCRLEVVDEVVAGDVDDGVDLVETYELSVLAGHRVADEQAVADLGCHFYVFMCRCVCVRL